MPAPKKSLRPKARPKSIYGVEEMSTRSPDGLTIAEREKKEKAEKKMYGGKMKKPVAMKSGGKMPMVKKGDNSVPALVSGMAYYIAMKKPDVAARVPLLKQEYEFQFQLAAGEDEETASIKFVPFDTFMMGG